MSTELEAFLLSALCGASVLLLWDFFHGMRYVFIHKTVGNIILDVIWWFVSVSMFLHCAWETLSLRLRFFEAFAAVAGAILYHFTVSGVLRRCFCWFFCLNLKIFKFIFKILLTPALFLYKILIEPLKKYIIGKTKRD